MFDHPIGGVNLKSAQDLAKVGVGFGSHARESDRMTAPSETDERLVLRVAQGDRAAFAHLVARHRGRISSMVARIVGDTGAAEDVMQEAFLRAWVKAPGWVAIAQGGSAQFSTWLSRV